MNFCPNCGNKVVEDSNFCSHCGYPLRQHVEVEATSNELKKPAESLIDNQESNKAITENEMLTQTEMESSSSFCRQLEYSLKNLYAAMLKTFSVPSSGGTLKQNFSRLRVRLSGKIKGYDSDELANVVEPMCESDHSASQHDIDFINGLINKYQNYFRKSDFESVLNVLSGQSSGAIVDAEHLTKVQKYMHVNRGTLEKDFLDQINKLNSQHGKLLLLVGNVGDGKSHLIGYMKKEHPDLFADKRIHIHYDATESFDPDKTAMDTLLDLLQPFSDNDVDNNTENWIVAINMGILVNLIGTIEKVGNFTKLLAFLNKTGIAKEVDVPETIDDESYSLISFRTYPVFKVDEAGVNSTFYDDIFYKITKPMPDNPFYSAYVNDEKHYGLHLAHYNYRLLCNENVQQTLKYLLIKVQLESKVIISTRSLLELIHDILLPTQLEEHRVINYEGSLPYLLFAGFGDSKLIKKISEFDPIKFQGSQIENWKTSIYSSKRELNDLASDLINNQDLQNIKWLWNYINEDRIDFSNKVGLLIRIMYLMNHRNTAFNDQYYLDYLKLLTAIQENGNHSVEAKNLFLSIKNFIRKWCGSPQNGFVYTFVNEERKFGIAIPLSLQFVDVQLVDYSAVITLKNNGTDNKYALSVDYDLFKLIKMVDQGYLLKLENKRQFVNVSSFIENIVKSDKAMKETLIGNIETKEFYRLTDNGFEIEMEGMD